MKKLILLFCIALTFNACKKTESLKDETVKANYSGIKNVEEFDKLIKEITLPINNKTNNESSMPKFKLSNEAIQELRSSIVFDKNGVFHGFKKMTMTNKELKNEECMLLFELIANTQIILLDKNSKIVSNTNTNNWTVPLTCHQDWTWDHGRYGTDCCKVYPDARCCTYGPIIICTTIP